MANKQHFILAKCYDKRGNLISVGFNSYTKSHPLQAYFANKVGHSERIYLHAEIQVLLRAKGKRVYKVTIERYGSNGLPMLAKPCPICMEALQAFGVSHITYTTTYGVQHESIQCLV